MTWSFTVDKHVVSWKFDNQHGSFLIDKHSDFTQLSKDKQIGIAETLTGIIPQLMLPIYPREKPSSNPLD